MKKSFRTRLKAAGVGEVGLIEIPFDVKGAFGAARAKVLATVKDVTWRTTVAVYGGKSYIGLRKEIFARSGAKIGESVEVALSPDLAPRVVRPPALLAAALKKDAAARSGWERMSYTHQKEWADAIEEAKKPETKAKRLKGAVEACRARAMK